MTGRDLDPIVGARQAVAAGCAEIAPIVMWAYLDGTVKEYDAIAAKLAAAEQERDEAQAQCERYYEAARRFGQAANRAEAALAAVQDHGHAAGVGDGRVDWFAIGVELASRYSAAALAAAEQPEPTPEQRVCESNPRIDGQPWEPWEGNGPCQDCGGRNIVWCTDNSAWARVMGERGGLLCPVCFVKRAHFAGLIGTWWLSEPAPEQP